MKAQVMTPEKWRQFNMLQDVITHFGSDSTLRCEGGDGCIYCPTEEMIKDNPKNIGCGIGMFLSWKVAKRIDDGGEQDIQTVLAREEYYDLLPKWMKDMDSTFLQSIQMFHDEYNHFKTKTGLTQAGLDFVKEICSTFDLPFDVLTIPQ